ncbi:4Fe-4S dicluster domain-containing protein [uncultured Clostridium sp.]|uniref:4Fe-4S dicluster domain-containing protein n=1 Tax=uncultured Clostridium sp. TaxID=59620 RepID=UPI0026100C66|nr:4Fe-4S dicluster domain-containing protein [uncultured Clostridium sp.]
MDIKFSREAADMFLKSLSEEYDIFAPIAYKNEGRYSNVDSIRYGKIESFNDVVFDKKSHYSAKEVLLPINHIYGVKINGNIIKNEDADNEKKKIIMLRSCDVHAIERIDNKFLSDDFYKARREKVKFMIMECPKAFDTCYCVSTKTNETENYSLGIRATEENIFIKVKDSDFDKYISDGFTKEEFDIRFAKEDGVVMKIPKLEVWDYKALDKVMNSKLWEEYKNRCIGCGSCNASCPTCTCLHTKEVPVNNSNVIEIRRVWNGCQLVKTKSLNGHTVKEVVPTRIRQRILDKFYNPKTENSQEQMCVGCGRCTDICPKLISFANTATRLAEELESN